jgi:hypothetical protein
MYGRHDFGQQHAGAPISDSVDGYLAALYGAPEQPRLDVEPFGGFADRVKRLNRCL